MHVLMSSRYRGFLVVFKVSAEEASNLELEMNWVNRIQTILQCAPGQRIQTTLGSNEETTK